MTATLEDAAPCVALPADRPRVSSQPYTSAQLSYELPNELSAALQTVAERAGCSTATVLYAAFATLLFRYTGELEFGIGSSGAEAGTLRVDLSGDPAFAELLKRTKADVRELPLSLESAPQEVTLSAAVDGRRLMLRWGFNAELFERATVERMARHYLNLLGAVAAEPELPLSRAPLMDERERAYILAHGLGEARPYERDATIPALFEQQAARTPLAIAVESLEGTLTYAELDARANRLAHHLRSLGVEPGASVGIALERTVDLPVGLLAILKAGAAYVPLDLTYPPERLQFMLEDAAVTLVVGDDASAERLAFCEAKVLAVDNDADEIAAQPAGALGLQQPAESLAYVIYTSGSSGRAKGVAVPHRGVVRLVRATNFIDPTPKDSFLQLAPVAFDASTLELWGPLLNGARVAIPPRGLLSVDEIGAAIQRFSVSMLFLTTSLFQRVVDGKPAGFEGLGVLMTGGDVVAPEYARRFLETYPACRLIHCYGPTENTTYSTTYEIPSLASIGTILPLGNPIAHSSAYVLDAHRALAPLGVPGELYVGGDGVALGYVNLAELSEQRFVPDPFALAPDQRLYATGDRIRMRDDGLFEFLGRADDQVKIRGFRVELGEIEVALRAHPELGDAAVVVAKGALEKTLLGFVVPVAGANVDERSLRSYLSAKLPPYMVPHRLLFVASLPQHPSGKLDRVALARSAATALEKPALSAPSPVTKPSASPAVQSVIAEIWREVLGLGTAPGLDENFFDAGGDSLLLLSAHERFKEKKIAVSVMDLFQHTTIRKLAAFVSNGKH